MPLEILDLGCCDFAEAWGIQQDWVRRRIRDEVPDVLILVEHPHVVTLGRKRPSSGICEPGHVGGTVPVFHIERGGEATYHGPGQLVGYPIVKLEAEQRDLHRYLRELEGLLIDVLGDFGVPAQRVPGATGVWTRASPSRKLASIGIAVRRWVTYHGFALNVSPDLTRFRLISPCGFDGSVMTSMERELGQALQLDDVKGRTAFRFRERYAARLCSRGSNEGEVPPVRGGSVTRS